jgi:hypothetical protein
MDTDTAEESPFFTIWDAPRATIRRIVGRDPRRAVNRLFFSAGVVGALDAIASWTARYDLPVPAIPLACLGLGLVSVATGHLNAWYKRWVGSLLGGVATRAEVAAVGAWSMVPVTAGHGLLWVVLIALYGAEPFSPERGALDAAPRLFRLSLDVATVLFTLWSVAVSVVGFAEVNRFSIARSITTTLLAALILAVATIVAAVGAIVVLGSGG